METHHLDPIDVLQYHLYFRLLPPRIPKMALRQQQTRSSQEDAYQVPRRRKSRKCMGQLATQ